MKSVAALALVVLTLPCALAQEAAESADEARVRAYGVATETESLGRFIAPPALDEATRTAALAALEELNDPDWTVREEAARKLFRLGPAVRPLLEAHEDAEDLETRDRIQQLLEAFSGDDHRHAQAAALRILASRRDPRAILPLLTALGRFQGDALAPLAVAAVSASLDPEAPEAVLAWAEDAENPVGLRADLVRALGERKARKAREGLARLLESDAAPVRLEAASALLAWGESAAGGALLDLLEDEHPLEVRYRAEYALRRVLGPAFDHNAYAPAADRAKSLETWRAWWRENGAAGALPAAEGPAEEEGITTIVDHSGDRVIEVDRTGKVVWEKGGIRGPCRSEWLPNGNLLVGGGYSQRLFELDREGREVWSSPVQTMYVDCDRLPNGNTLATSFSEKWVAELDREGNKVWEFVPTWEGTMTDADRLPSGNTLICDYSGNRLVEVTPAGEVVWEVRTLAGPYEADRLPNGNTLVAESSGGRVSEIDREGRVVWKYEGLEGCHHVDRLAGGNTLICDSEGDRVLEVTPEGEVVWEFTGARHPDDADRR